MFRQFSITERVKLEFRMESFKLFEQTPLRTAIRLPARHRGRHRRHLGRESRFAGRARVPARSGSQRSRRPQALAHRSAQERLRRRAGSPLLSRDGAPPRRGVRAPRLRAAAAARGTGRAVSDVTRPMFGCPERARPSPLQSISPASTSTCDRFERSGPSRTPKFRSTQRVKRISGTIRRMPRRSSTPAAAA